MKLPHGQYDEPPTDAAPWEIAGRWVDRLAHGGWEAVAIAAIAAIAASWLWRKVEARDPAFAARIWPRLRAIAIAVAIALGLGLALARVSLVDDAFISFRYADNWARGRGPVFNRGEYVQGYTNFLWMALLAIGTWVTGLPTTAVALALGPLVFAANILVLAGMGRTLAGLGREGARHVPLAAALFAVNSVATQYATTGLETGAASLAVNLGCWALLARDDLRGAFVAGLAFTVASLLRLDQGLFQAMGLAIVAVRSRSPRQVAAFLAPAILLVGWAVFADLTYGEILPNTFEAKASGAWDPFQAGLYAELWLLGTHAWIPIGIGATWAVGRAIRPDPSRREARFGAGLVVTAIAWQIWLLRIGGDFMYGRFYQSFFPLFLLAAERAAHEWGRAGRIAGIALAATAVSVPMIQHEETEWYVADEPTFYPVVGFFPPVVDHHSYRIGALLGRALSDRGMHPVVATSGPGMVAYLSDLTTIDVLGLTDRHVARSPSLPNGRPGHAKVAGLDYLIKRKVRFGHVYPPPSWIDVARLDLEGAGGDWFIVTYQGDLMRRIEREAPEIHFVDFERWLDRYVEHKLPRLTAGQALDDLYFMDNYYFRENGAGRWRDAIADHAGFTPQPAP